jgi:hypothetical protein
MSHATIHQASKDTGLNERTVAAVHREALSSPVFSITIFGKMVRDGVAPIISRFSFPIAVDTEAAYESAIIAGIPNPGSDPAVITDSAITSAVQAHWPADEDLTLP